jgi:hypothetical protein
VRRRARGIISFGSSTIPLPCRECPLRCRATSLSILPRWAGEVDASVSERTEGGATRGARSGRRRHLSFPVGRGRSPSRRVSARRRCHLRPMSAYGEKRTRGGSSGQDVLRRRLTGVGQQIYYVVRERVVVFLPKREYHPLFVLPDLQAILDHRSTTPKGEADCDALRRAIRRRRANTLYAWSLFEG